VISWPRTKEHLNSGVYFIRQCPGLQDPCIVVSSIPACGPPGIVSAGEGIVHVTSRADFPGSVRMKKRFSDRQGYSAPEQPITIREDAPDNLRWALVQIAYDAGLTPKGLRSVATKVLRVPPDPNNWSGPNVDGEARELISGAPWYSVYDIAESIYAGLIDDEEREAFASELNRSFRENGIGWQMLEGRIEMRGDSEFDFIGQEPLSPASCRSRMPDFCAPNGQ
jgi:AbiJ-like protein